MTADLLQFAKVMENPMYCQLSRGKFEADIAHFATLILYDLNKLATDLLLFSTSEFGFVDLSFEICTGSSIMPQKKNPDVLELLRAKYHVAVAEEMKIKGIMATLPSGYNKDLQLTKEPLFTVCDMTIECLEVMGIVVENMQMNEEKCKAAMTEELFATEEAYELVRKGMSFRDAYKEVGKKYS
ncbi:hypothetical protein HZA99_04625 [Candidatus Woesearchaeota archaeon]|nr:hypothetical protein [Candidatus Woesearchaeota archaeon]